MDERTNNQMNEQLCLICSLSTVNGASETSKTLPHPLWRNVTEGKKRGRKKKNVAAAVVSDFRSAKTGRGNEWVSVDGRMAERDEMRYQELSHESVPPIHNAAL